MCNLRSQTNQIEEDFVNESNAKSWEPWKNGPELHKSSYTSKLLYYLTPKSAHLESRRLFIGEFPEQWVENNVPLIINDAWKIVNDNYELLVKENPDIAHRDNEMSLADGIADFVRPLHECDPKTVMEKELELKKRKRLLRQETISNFKDLHFNKVPLSLNTPEDKLGDSKNESSANLASSFKDSVPSLVSGSSDSTEYFDADETTTNITDDNNSLVLLENNESTATTAPLLDLSDSKLNLAKEKTQKNDKAAAIYKPSGNPQSYSDYDAINSVRSERSEYYNANTDTGSLGGRMSIADDMSNLRPEALSAFERERLLHTGQKNSISTLATLGTTLGAMGTPNIVSSGSSDSSQSGLHEQLSLKPSLSTSNAMTSARADLAKKLGNHIPIHKDSVKNAAGNIGRTVEANITAENVKRQVKKVRYHKKRQLIYQGRFLVQERHFAPGLSLNSQCDTASRSKLVNRWKEYAVYLRKTSNPSQPLVMYLYASINESKLSRRSQRKWSRSLEYKIKLDSSYGLSIFSTLDFSLALSRCMDGGTRVLIIQSPSSNAIFLLTCILMEASQGFSQVHLPLKLCAEVTSSDLKIDLLSYRASYAIMDDPTEPVKYEDLKKPTANPSTFIKSAATKVHNVISRMTAPPLDKKITFAWVFPEFSRTPFWLASSISNFYPLTKLNKLLPSKATLSVVNPEPSCYANDEVEEPPPPEGYCPRVNVVRGKMRNVYLHVHDHYLLISCKDITPPFLAASQNTLVKTVNPYPLNHNKDIRWITQSTCSREIEYNDALARIEHDRTAKSIANSTTLFDLISCDTIDFAENNNEIVQLKCQKELRCQLNFRNSDVAHTWLCKLQATSDFWYYKLSFPKPQIEACITPFLQNRSVVISGTMFIKKHRMATFKSCVVLLTPYSLVVFRPSQKGNNKAHPRYLVPRSSLPQRKWLVIDLKDTYAYSGQLAAHALLDNNRLDSSDPANRGLPCIYENGQTGYETEIERSIVVWQTRKSRVSKLVSEAGSGEYVVLLAKNKYERDRWALAIRYVQSNIASKSFEHEELDIEEIVDDKPEFEQFE